MRTLFFVGIAAVVSVAGVAGYILHQKGRALKKKMKNLDAERAKIEKDDDKPWLGKY